MTDRGGDKSKQPEGCNETEGSCPNMKCTYEGWEYERYRCEVCGASYTLYDDDMR